MNSTPNPSVTPTEIVMGYFRGVSPSYTEALACDGASPLKVDCVCVVCFQKLKQGSLGHRAKFTQSFVDSPYLQAPSLGGSACICPGCKVILGNPLATVQLTYAAVGKNDAGEFIAYSTLKDVDFVAAMLKPPKAPFIFTLKRSKKQHMVWKSRVNLSDSTSGAPVFYSFGNQNLYCKPWVLVTALRKQEELLAALNAQLPKGRRPFGRLFASLSRTADSHDDFRGISFENLVEDQALLGRVVQFQSLIQSLSFGDRFFYSALCRVRNHALEKTIDEFIADLTPTPVDPSLFTKGI